MVTTALNATLDTNLTELEREVLGFKPSQGGLGLPSASFIAGALYTASRAQTGLIQASLMRCQEDFDTICIHNLLDEISENQGLDVALTIEDVQCSNPQARLCSILDFHRSKKVQNNLGPRQKKLLEARQNS
jgi:hypothetical protein